MNVEKSSTVRSEEEEPLKETKERPVKWHFRNKVMEVFILEEAVSLSKASGWLS